MCFNFEVSIITFIVGSIGIIKNFCKFKNDSELFYLNIYFIPIILMQLWEALIWKNYKYKLITKLALMTNIIQPFFILLLLNIKQITFEEKILILFVLIIYMDITKDFFKKNYGCILRKNAVFLEWWGEKKKLLFTNFYLYPAIIYHIFSIILLKILLSNELGNSFVKIFLSSFFIVSIIGEKYKYYENYGSVWCFVAAYVPYLISNM